MTLEEYLSLLESPETVDEGAIDDLQALLRYAPYCSSARILLLKAFHRSHNTNYNAELPKTVLYAHSNEQLYFLLHPKEVIRQVGGTGSDYFSFIEQLQAKAEQTGESFHDLALKFQQARMAYLQQSQRTPVAQKEKDAKAEPEMSEERARECIQKHDYQGALEILRVLHLHSPKKSSYFADQIAFLEKAVALQAEQGASEEDNR